MKLTVREHWSLIAAMLLFGLTIALVLLASLEQNQGHFVYDVDDPYIHMAMARNLVQHGVWGVTRYEFSSSSSSILWTLLIAIIYLSSGVNDLVPFILNIVFATLTIFSAHKILVTLQPQLSPLYRLLILLALIYLTPLPALLFSGHEHTLHLLLSMLIVYFSSNVLSGERRGDVTFLMVLAPLITLVRFEGVFLILVICSLFALRRRWRHAFALGGIAVAPIAVYSVISLAQGWFWLPNSVLLKSNLPSLTGVANIAGHSLYENLLAAPHLALLLTTAVALCTIRFRQSGLWARGQLMLIILIGMTLLHLQFVGPVRWFYRHDAYLVGTGLFILALVCSEYLPFTIPPRAILAQRAAVGLLIASLVVIFPLTRPGIRLLTQRGASTLHVAQATTNIYEQQYQMGLFLRQFYTGASVAANDIGAMNYLADIQCLDLDGLANMDIARLKRADQLTAEAIYRLAQAEGTRVAIIYDAWFKYGDTNRIPSRWIKVGEWTISQRVSAWGDTVSFYATAPSEQSQLVANLSAFSSQLPPTVKQVAR